MSISEDNVVKFLVDIPEKIFTLHIKSSNILLYSTEGDGKCEFRALCQASKRAVIPLHLRETTPITDMDYDIPDKRKE